MANRHTRQPRGLVPTALACWVCLVGCTVSHDVDGLSSGPEPHVRDASGEEAHEAAPFDAALGDAAAEDAVACVPITCADVTPRCGAISDGCASTITCTCLAPSACGPDGRCACSEVPAYAEAAPHRIQNDDGNYPGNPVPWVTTMGAATLGGDRATATLAFDKHSMRLHATEFGFAIPLDATISGIELFLVKSSNPSSGGFGSIDDKEIGLLKGGDQQGERKQDIDWPQTDKEFRYGSSTDGWGTTWTPADINATQSFGAVVRAYNGSASGNTVTARLDFIKIRVHYFPKCQAVSVAD